MTDETTADDTREPSRVVQQRGLYLDELEVGAVYRHAPGRTVTEADNVLFTTLTMNPQALHLDTAYASTTEFEQRLVNSMWTLSTLIGLSVAQLTQATLVAQLGLTDVRFPQPLFIGDTLYAETTVLDRRDSASRPGQGIATMLHTGRNQHGELVASVTRVALMLRAPEVAA